jgi:hypothetical protein
MKAGVIDKVVGRVENRDKEKGLVFLGRKVLMYTSSTMYIRVIIAHYSLPSSGEAESRV